PPPPPPRCDVMSRGLGDVYKRQLPKNTIVAHKTGTSGINNGIAAATNDVGVITLPNGQLIFISVFVAESKETSEINEKIISDIAKITWNYYLNK
ncbi:serine hydrolase, partial [Klebsiella pneumoniae]|uniref:serine hydrolase n=1 Tax=Klebsiella pneumoniae TaxID=573 RepID=UPI003D32D4A5